MGEPKKKASASAQVVSFIAAFMLIGGALYLLGAAAVECKTVFQQCVVGIDMLAGTVWFCTAMVIFAIQSK